MNITRGVCSLKEYEGFFVDEELNIYNKKGMKITPFLGTDGYMHIRRRLPDGKYKYMRAHRLYAILFIPNPNNYKYVNHKDSDKTNNSLENLEWTTNSVNVKHGWDSGNRTHKNNTHVDVYLDGEYVGTWTSIRKLSSELKLDRHKVARILKGELKNCYKFSFSYSEVKRLSKG